MDVAHSTVDERCEVAEIRRGKQEKGRSSDERDESAADMVGEAGWEPYSKADSWVAQLLSKIYRQLLVLRFRPSVAKILLAPVLQTAPRMHVQMDDR